MQIWSLYEGKHLFDSRTDENKLSNTKHLSQIVAYLGPPAREFLERKGDVSLFFDENCKCDIHSTTRLNLQPTPGQAI